MKTSILMICALLISATLLNAADDDLQAKCSSAFTKVTSCLSFVTAKAATPTKECCSNVNEIRKDDPACLCYFIQVANNGSAEQIKSLGVKISQLLLLPSACNVPNSNISDCPKLLGLPANSPAAQVFTNLTSTTTPTPSSGGTTTTVPTTTSSGNDTADSATGLNHFAAFLMAIIIAVSTSVFTFA